LAGGTLPLDLAANAASLGAEVITATTLDEFRAALQQARANATITVVHIEDDPTIASPDSASWWDVPVAEVSTRRSTHEALARYQTQRTVQRNYLRPATWGDEPRGS